MGCGATIFGRVARIVNNASNFRESSKHWSSEPNSGVSVGLQLSRSPPRHFRTSCIKRAQEPFRVFNTVKEGLVLMKHFIPANNASRHVSARELCHQMKHVP